ncbi:MAG: dipeptidase [Pseudomonadota bacterium]
MRRSFGFTVIMIGVSTMLGCVANAPASKENGARALHERLMVLDTHLDTPLRMQYPGFSIVERHSHSHDFSQVDLPRMQDGGLDGGFWVIFTRQGELTTQAYENARDGALLRAVTIQRMLAEHSEHFGRAVRSEDARRIVADGKRVVFQSIENAYPIGTDLSLLDTFYKLGVRMVGPVHSSNNQFADSSTDANGQVHNGLSELGRQLIARANELGMIVDASHAHDEALIQMIELSRSPIILSHTGATDVFAHPRNINDTLLKRLADSGGVIQMNALGAYMKEMPGNSERWAELGALAKRYPQPDQMTLEQAQAFFAERRELEKQFDIEPANFEDYMAHFLHVLRLIGPDHVGVGADWDGGGGVAGMEDISALPKITERLLAEGYSEADIAKIWGGNVVRLLEQAEKVASESS